MHARTVNGSTIDACTHICVACCPALPCPESRGTPCTACLMTVCTCPFVPRLYCLQVQEYKYEIERLQREIKEVKRKYFEQKRAGTAGGSGAPGAAGGGAGGSGSGGGSGQQQGLAGPLPAGKQQPGDAAEGGGEELIAAVHSAGQATAAAPHAALGVAAGLAAL